METIEERCRLRIANQTLIDYDKIVLAARLEQDLGMDSLDAVEVVMELEDEFGIEIPDGLELGDGGPDVTFKDLVEYIEKRVTVA